MATPRGHCGSCHCCATVPLCCCVMFAYELACVCVFLCVPVCIPVWACVFLYVSVCACVCVYLCVLLCVAHCWHNCAKAFDFNFLRNVCQLRPSLCVYVCVCLCMSIKAAGQLLTVFVNCFLLLLYSIFYFLKISRTQIKR